MNDHDLGALEAFLAGAFDRPAAVVGRTLAATTELSTAARLEDPRIGSCPVDHRLLHFIIVSLAGLQVLSTTYGPELLAPPR